MDLKCGCCGGELSWAEWDVLEKAQENEVIIFTCVQCKCGYDTSASRTHMCEEPGKNIFKFTAPTLHKEAGESRIRKGDRNGKHLVLKPTRPHERFVGTEKASRHSIGNILFDFLFGPP